jgi:radical SAM superfamily enzyme YgiQ (UPF0313 family)
MRRGVTVEQVRWATKAAQRHGMQVGMFLMWGYDGETVEDIALTVEHVVAANPDIFFTTVAYPIKNTPYFGKVASRLSLPSDWAAATDRDFVVGGRPSRDYYRLADRWLRGAVEATRLTATDPAAAAAHRARAEEARDELLRASEIPA